MNDKRISLASQLQAGLFLKAMTVLHSRRHELNRYDHDLVVKLYDGWQFAGRELTITVKQLNHIQQVAMELEGGRYDG